jgi:hypothetical protein
MDEGTARTLIDTLDRPERLARAGMGAVAHLAPDWDTGRGDRYAERIPEPARPP